MQKSSGGERGLSRTGYVAWLCGAGTPPAFLAKERTFISYACSELLFAFASSVSGAVTSW